MTRTPICSHLARLSVTVARPFASIRAAALAVSCAASAPLVLTGCGAANTAGGAHEPALGTNEELGDANTDSPGASKTVGPREATSESVPDDSLGATSNRSQAPADGAVSDSPLGSDADSDEPPKTPAPLPEGTTVLHIGDSFAGALGHELNRELKTHGVRGVLEYEKSTYIPTWASKRELPTYLSRYKPDLILVTLGGNELSIVHPEQRAETVRRLVARFGDIPCVWIGIPLWEGANPTLMGVVRDNVEQCLFLDTHALIPDMQRAKDKIHPSLSARTQWAKTVVDWLQQHRVADGDKPWALEPDD